VTGTGFPIEDALLLASCTVAGATGYCVELIPLIRQPARLLSPYAFPPAAVTEMELRSGPVMPAGLQVPLFQKIWPMSASEASIGPCPSGNWRLRPAARDVRAVDRRIGPAAVDHSRRVHRPGRDGRARSEPLPANARAAVPVITILLAFMLASP
jgi:hypothetical protein